MREMFQAFAITFISSFILVPLFLGLARLLGLYVIVKEGHCQVYLLFGKVIAVLEEPGLHFLLGTLGWRALAREMSGRASPGGGVLAKGLLAFAGTYAAGLALDQLHSLGRSMTRDEKRDVYDQAYRVGRRVLDGILDTMVSPPHQVRGLSSP